MINIHNQLKSIIIGQVFDSWGLACYRFPRHVLKHFCKMTNHATYAIYWVFNALGLHHFNATTCVYFLICIIVKIQHRYMPTPILQISAPTLISYRYRHSPTLYCKFRLLKFIEPCIYLDRYGLCMNSLCSSCLLTK